MIKKLLFSSLFLLVNMAGLRAQAPVTIISPVTNNGGFESATATPWVIVNGSQTNKWVISTNATPGFSGTRAAYVSDGTVTPFPHTYTFTSSTSVYLYQDVTFPAGNTGPFTLSFKAIQAGETNFDQAVVYMSTGTPGTPPTAGTSPGPIASQSALAGFQQLFVVPSQTTPGWQTYSISIPSSVVGNSGTTSSTRRLMFRWMSGSTLGTNPPIGLDDVMLVAGCAGANITQGPTTSPTTCTGTDGTITINNLSTSAGVTYTLQYRRNGVPVSVPGISPSLAGTYTISNLSAAYYDSISVVETGGCQSNFIGPVTLTTVGSPVAPTASANNPVCLGSTLTLTVSNPNAASTYNWFGPNGFTATGSTVTRNNIGYSDTGTYYVTATNASGCVSAPRAVVVNITPPSPDPTANPQSFCQNSSGRNLVAFGSTLLFYTAPTGGTGTSSLAPNTSTAGNFTYYVTQNTTGCPSQPRTPIAVTITPIPTAPLVPYDTVEYCQFTNPSPLLSYATNPKFYTNAIGGFGSSSLTPSTANPGKTTFYVSQTVNGCESPRTPILVVVYPKPAPPTVTSPVNLCQNTTPQPLTAQGQNLLWYDVPTGGTGLSVPPSPPTGREASFTYYVVQSINGCESDRVAIQVNVNYQPNATFVPSKNYVCVADTISFRYFGNARPDAQYNWTVPPSAQILSGNNTQGPLVVRFNDTGIYEVRLDVNNKGCVSSPVFQRFEVRSRPEVRINARRELCVGEVTEITLDSLSANISSFNWSFGDGEVVYSTPPTGPYGVRWNTSGTKTIFVNTVSRQCGSFPRGEVFTVRPAPAASIINKPTTPYCSGDSIRLQATDLGPGYSYEWSPAGLFRSFERAGTTVWAIAPGINVAAISTTDVTLTVTDTLGCKGTDAVTVTSAPCCGVAFPNAFTPNGDGTNDLFSIITNGRPQISSFRIFNRMGNTVFETGNSLLGWDGNSGSEPQPMGVYYYYLKYRCAGRDYETKGDITLIR